jgi:hypothetical protein
MSSDNYEESGYGLGLDLLIVTYDTKSCVSYPLRSGLVGQVAIKDPSTLGI